MTEDRKIELMLTVTKAFNPLVRWLLKSRRLHGIISEDILLLHFQGRKPAAIFLSVRVQSNLDKVGL